ncbi:GNAT family N-acetyltransferase [Arthrobacter sp. Hor0625]|uniref:GNAT family N-acetyltransferase n=1 Tax=Arthrobacter sp. Hor0625 TaxID=3457358 RepID=UPI00403EB047
MSKQPDYTIRAMSERHCKAVMALAYDAFPFEKDRELEKFGPDYDPVAKLKGIVGPFNITGSVHFVAVDKKDKVLGFAVVQRMVSTDGRVSKSVLLMPRVTVAERNRRKGIGTLLLSRVRSFAAKQGYGEVMASIPERLEGWYKSAGWTVSPAGHIYTILELPHTGDDRFLPIPVPKGRHGQFTPFQSQEPGPTEHGYSLAARATTNVESALITSWTYVADGDDQFRSLWSHLMDNPDRIPAVPFMNCIVLGEFMRQAGAPENEMKVFVDALKRAAPRNPDGGRAVISSSMDPI